MNSGHRRDAVLLLILVINEWDLVRDEGYKDANKKNNFSSMATSVPENTHNQLGAVISRRISF